MGIFSSLSKAMGFTKDINVEEFMTAAEAEDVDVMHKAADYYVKPIALQNEGDVIVVKEELTNRNHVLLNFSPIMRNPAKLKQVVGDLRAFVHSINGDIARIDEDKILLTPHNVKIVKKRHG
ncbi:MAG: cell division protein SepF [Candidatus Micrarchaeota archaeon]